MTRRMAEEAYRGDQWARRYAEHVRPINDWIDAQRETGGWMPYVAPVHGGVYARVLSILRDPGPKTRDDGGSGFLSVENDDPTAAAQAELFAGAGIDLGDVTPWNAYPWYINRAPNAAERRAGVAPLLALVAMMPRLQVVLLQGGDAKAGWRDLTRVRDVATERRLHVVATYHPGRQAMFHPSSEVRERRAQDRADAYGRVHDMLVAGDKGVR